MKRYLIPGRRSDDRNKAKQWRKSENQFVSHYVSFVQILFPTLPSAHFVLLSSPMTSPQLNTDQHNHIISVDDACQKMGTRDMATFSLDKTKVLILTTVRTLMSKAKLVRN